MKKKILEALKAAAKYFSTAAGAVSLVIGLVTLAVIVPPFISIPIIVLIGAGFAYLGARRAWNQFEEEDSAKNLLDLERQAVKNEQNEMLGISRNLDKRMTEIAEAERKIHTKLEQAEFEHKQEVELKHELEHKLELERKFELEYRHELERQHHQQQAAMIQSGPETPVSYKHTIPSHAVSVSREHHASCRPQVTIRINNLPTFFSVDHHSERSSPSPVVVRAAVDKETKAVAGNEKKGSALTQ
jgi:hypothetical protein